MNIDACNGNKKFLPHLKRIKFDFFINFKISMDFAPIHKNPKVIYLNTKENN